MHEIIGKVQSWQKLLWTVCAHLNLYVSSREITKNYWVLPPPLPLHNVECKDINIKVIH